MNPTSMKYTCKSVNPITKESTIYVGLVVDAVLSSAILRAKTTELVTAWPLLGGRIIRRTSPRSFTCGSTVDFASRTRNESLATYLPLNYNKKDKPSIIQSPEVSCVDQKFIFDVSNTIFKVRVTVLQDATLLCFGITHYLCDGSSCFEVVKAFCNILSNKPIPSLVLSPDAEGFCDLASDLPLASSVLFKAKGTLLSSKVISDSTGEESAIYYETQQQNFDTGILKLGRLVWRVVSSKVAAQFGLIDKLTTKFVHLPGTWVNELKARSQEELAVQSLEITLTRNDIIAAWILKVIYSPQPASSAPVDYYGSIDYRQFTDHFEPDTYYIHNAIGLVRCKFSVEQLQKESLANIARDIRLTTLRYKCHESAKQNLRFVEDNINKVLIPSTRAGGNLSFVALSQWTTYDYTSLDFSRASPNGKKPSISFVNPAVSVHMNLILGPIALLAKNGLGDYWVRIGNNSTGWKNFDRSSSMESLFPDQEDCSPT